MEEMMMTTVSRKFMKCSVCGEDSQHEMLASTNSFGSMDLDTRPPEMERSTITYWVYECPHCGYISDSLDKPILCDKKYLNTSEYKNFPDTFPIFELTRQFVRKARISVQEADYVKAFWDYLHAAWTSDDQEDSKWQFELRMLALQMIDKFKDQDMKDGIRVLRADLLRKTRQFKRLMQEYENVSFDSDLLNKIVHFQILKAQDGDTKTYTVAEVTL
jgi:hypothetical protein